MKTAVQVCRSSAMLVVISASLAAAGDMKAVLDPSGNFQIQNSASNLLLQVQSGGNVGIGTASPAAKLHVAGDANVANYLLIGNAIVVSDGGTYPRIDLDGASTSYKALNMRDTTSGELWQLSHRTHADGNSFLVSYFDGTGWKTPQSILPSGNVGIGTTTPQTVLEVRVPANTIHGEQISSSDSHWLRLMPSLGAGSYNGLVQAGDLGIIFSKGPLDSGSLVIAPHANAVSGIRITAAGNVGIGTTAPQTALDVTGTVRAQNFLAGAGTASLPSYYFGSAIGSTGMYAPEANVVGFATSGGERMRISANGFVGIGANPATKLHVRVDANKNILVRDSTGFGTGQAGVVLQSVNDALNAFEPLTVESSLVLLNPATRGSVGIGTVSPQATLDVNGTTRTKVLTITGGADVAEPFAISGDEVPAGAVVIIDDENPGQLMVSESAYDTRVAGIVSGAGGVNPGLTLSQQELVEGGRNVALTGRVYALADATGGAIRPGDLLTTSNTRGHAMKVTESAQAQGAILGKAMSRLDSGRGLVLVLVSLQ